MDNTVTIYRDGDITRVNLRYSKGCLNCSTSLTPDEVREAIKGIDLPTSRERAAARKKAIESAMEGVAHLITDDTVEVYWPEGCAPYTRNVEASNAGTHIAANDRCSSEAELLLAVKNGDSLPAGWKHISEGEDAAGEWCDVYRYEA